MTNEQLKELGAKYTQTLSDLLDALPNDEAATIFVQIAFNGMMAQLTQRCGPGEVSTFLRRAAAELNAESRKSLQ